MRNARLDETQAGIKIAGRNINNLRYADDTTFMAENEEELRNLWMKVKEESEKAGLKLSIQKMKIMASNPITSWQIDGEKVDRVVDFIFSPKIKTFALWKKNYDKVRQYIKKQRYHSANKRSYSQRYGFSGSQVWM